MWTSTLVLCCSLAAWTIVRVRGQSCPAGHVVGSKCYHLRSTAASWTDAENNCQRLGGHLAAADSIAKQTILQQLMMVDSLGDVWLGGQLEAAVNDKGLWKWISDGTALAGQGCFEDRSGSRDLPDEQHSLTGVTPSTCMSACKDKGKAYAGVQDGRRCFCGDSYGRYQLRSDCTTRCEADTAYKCGGQSSNFVYKIGGTFGQWAYAQPNDFRGFQHCATISKFVEFKLGDEQCYKDYGYICDVPHSNCNGGGSSGQTGYLLLNTSCVYVTTTKTSWFKARTDCQARGGELLKIDSAVMQETIKTKFASASGDRTYWVGLSKRLWTWTSGESFKYSNWRTESPSGEGGGCLRATAGDSYKWSNDDCSNTRVYYCLTDFVETTTTTTITTTTPPTTTTTTTPPTPLITTTTIKYFVETTTTVATTTKLPTTTAVTATTTTTTMTSAKTTAQPTSTTPKSTTSRAIAVPTKTIIMPTKRMPESSSQLPTKKTTKATLKWSNTTGTASGGVGPTPSTGKSTGSLDGLSTVELILIIICIILLLFILLIIIILCYYKAQARNGAVHPGKHDDFRHVASVPFSTPYVIDDGYATNSDFGSTAGLVSQKGRKVNRNGQYKTNAKIVVEDDDLYY